MFDELTDIPVTFINSTETSEQFPLESSKANKVTKYWPILL